MTVRHISTGSSRNALKLHNVSAVLLSLLRHERISRVHLAHLSGLSTTTITNLTAELLEQGIIAEEGTEIVPPSQRGVGRPRTSLRLIPEARYAVGVHFDVGTVRVALTDLRARLVCSDQLNHSPNAPPEAVLDEVATAVKTLIDNSGVNPQQVVGVGVGPSGLVDPSTGVNLFAPNAGWRNVPVRALLSRQLNMPIGVDNDVRGMALVEALFGGGKDAGTLAFINAFVGVGAGFVVNGQPYRGSGAGAGEIGHTTIIYEGGEICRCGNTGCLETLVSEPAILRRAEEIARQDGQGILASFLSRAEGTPTERVFAAARHGDSPTRAMLSQVACHMGTALANLVNIFNPDLIVLGGIFAQGADLFLPRLEAAVKKRAFGHLGDRVRLQTTSFDPLQVGMIGAAALALNAFFYRQSEETP